MMYIYIGLCILLLLWLAPLLKRVRPSLPVLWIEATGSPLPHAKHKTAYLPYARLEKLLSALTRKHFTPVLPAEIIKGTCPQNPVLLIFDGGYQTFYTHVFPLLEKYNFRAAITLPAGLIGQYNRWEEKGPWQNLLTAAQAQTLQKSGRVEFISAGLDYSDLNNLPIDSAVWQLQESKSRLTQLYRLPVCAYFFSSTSPQNAAVLTAARQDYSLLFSRCLGNNRWPLSQMPLHILPVKKYTCLHRLCWKLRRP